MSYVDQIKDLQNTRAEKVSRMTTITDEAKSAERTKSADEQTAFDTLKGEVEAIDKELDDLRVMEKLMAEKAVPVPEVKDNPGVKKDFAVVKNTEKLEPGIAFARFAMCNLAAKGNPSVAFEIAKHHYPHMDSLCKTLQYQSQGGNLAQLMNIRATVNAGSTIDSVWAAPLVDYNNFAGDFVDFARNATILGQFGQNGVPSLRRVPFNIQVSSQTTGGAGYWVGEGKPKPLTSFEFANITLRWNKAANIAVLTDELVRFSNPSADRLVRDALVGALRERLDIDFIDPSKAAVANVSPASITNGIAPVGSGSGTDADAVRCDMQKLIAPFIAAKISLTSGVLLMSATTAMGLTTLYNAFGQREFPDMTMTGGRIMGFPVIVSEYLDNSAGSAGGIVILVAADELYLADDGDFTIDASREASLEMSNTPTNASYPAVGTSLVSMFQTNSVAIRVERYITWAKRRAAAAQWLDGVSWGAC